MKDLHKLTPFKYFVLTNFPYIEADFDALTNYELFCKVAEYLNNISASQNDVIDDFNELMQNWENYSHDMDEAWAEYKRTLNGEWHDVNEAWVEYKNYIDNYFDNLDVQEEINNKLDEMATDGTLGLILFDVYGENVRSWTINYLSIWLYENIAQETGYVLDKSLKVENAGADAFYTGLADELEKISYNQNILEQYLYKKNTYVNNSGVETTLNGYDTYRIPCDPFTPILLKWDANNPFYNALTLTYVFKFVNNDDSYTNMTSNVDVNYFFDTTDAYCFVIAPADVKYFSFTTDALRLNTIDLIKTNPYSELLDNNLKEKTKFPVILTEDTAIKSMAFSRHDGIITSLINGYYALTKVLKTGDTIIFNEQLPSVNAYGTYRTISGNTVTIQNITEPIFTATEDTIVHCFETTGYEKNALFIPFDKTIIDWNQIINTPENFSPFNRLNGVAFGTSLTYRSQTTGGFLTKLTELSGINFDNQGIGSSNIHGTMLTAIKSYTDYSDKRICTLEGFVNDWYTDQPLGNYTDTTEDTVCGCVRSALNYILSQNEDITVFLILDHYGRNYSGTDCSTTAINSSNLTQYEYYEEISKVAESLGIPVIKEYALSQISENTPQYLLDNIHCNTLGADQSAYTIWSVMKNHYANLI